MSHRHLGNHPPRMEGEKTCTQCHKTLPITEFPPQRENRDGRGSHCRKCKNAYQSPVAGRAPQECAWCHQTFLPKRIGKGQRYCSALCQRGAALHNVQETAHNSAASNEKRRQAQLRLIAEGRHLFSRKHPRGSPDPAAPAALTAPAAPAAPDSLPPRITTTTPDLPPDLPPLPPLPDGVSEEALDTFTPDQPDEEQGALSPPSGPGWSLTFPLQGAEARNTWQTQGERRETQADKLLQLEASRGAGRTLLLAGQGSYLGVENGALIIHQGRTHGVPAPARELLSPAMHDVKRITWIGAHGHASGTMTLAAVAWCQREGIQLTASPPESPLA